MKHLRTSIILLVIALMTSVSATAQRERNYIYLLDCTKSMIGHGGTPKIWQPTKEYLKSELEKHAPGTTLHVVPFQGKVLPAFNFKAEDLSWKDINKELEKQVQNVTNTNICDAWDATDGYIDPHKDNYIILLTDGKDNVKGRDELAKKLTEWCGKHPNTYAFYVQLTEAAVDEKVAKVINICDNEFIVDARKGIPVFGSFDNGLVIYANTLNLKKVHQIDFSSAGKYMAKAVCDDPYFDVKIVDDKIENGIVHIRIDAKAPISQINAAIPEIYNFTFDVRSEDVDIINPTIRVEMTKKPERALETLSEETDMGKAKWYDGFLFWGASKPDTLHVDLKAVFNDEAKKDGSTVELLVADEDGGKDFLLLYNGQEAENGRIVLRSGDGAPSILSLVFNPEAKEGKRYLTIKAKTKHELDKINGQPVEQYNLTLRAKYSVVWNPLKTILMWIGILVVAALLLWFLMFRRLIYPSINVRTIQINDPYFSKVNVKGKRRVVFTNKNMKQGIISRIFTGEILYKKNEIWTSPLGFEAGTKRRTLRVIRTKDYTFDPYTSLLSAPNDYVVENVNDKTKIKMTIN